MLNGVVLVNLYEAMGPTNSPGPADRFSYADTHCADQMSGGPKVRPLSFNNKLLIATMIAVSYIAFAASAQAQWPVTTNVDPSYSVEIGSRFFDRPGDDLGIGLATDPVTNEILFNTQDATDLNAAVGADIRLHYHGPREGKKWEFRTLLVNFDTTTEATGNNLNVPLLPNTVAPELINYRYDSDILSFELNHRRAVYPGVTFLIGPRYISIDETALFTFEDDIVTPLGPFTVTGGQEIEVKNSIIGAQAGFEFGIPISQTVYISSTNKFGGYYNPTEVNTSTFDNVTGSTLVEQTKSTGTFVAEIGGRVNFEVIPGCLTTFVGYDAMWIDGIALAPAQFLTTGTNTGVDTTNTPFFQSITAGLILTY